MDEPAYKVQTVGFKARVDKLKSEQTAFLSAAEEAAVSRSEEIQAFCAPPAWAMPAWSMTPPTRAAPSSRSIFPPFWARKAKSIQLLLTV